MLHSMDRIGSTDAPRERILKTAEKLFYQQGYQATGVNQIIDESGVAKATFYSHFPSKDDLCMAYLENMRAQEEQLVRSEMQKRRTAIARYLAPIEILESWLEETEYRGCAFLNMASEVPQGKNPLRRVGVGFYKGHTALVEEAVRDLKKADPKKYGGLNPSAVAQQYMVIFLGAIGLCQIFQSLDPLKDGIRMVKGLIER